MEDIRRLDSTEFKNIVRDTVRVLERDHEISVEEFIVEILKNASELKPPASIYKVDMLRGAINYFYPVLFRIDDKKRIVNVFDKLCRADKIECLKTAQDFDFEFEIFKIDFKRCFMLITPGVINHESWRF